LQADFNIIFSLNEEGVSWRCGNCHDTPFVPVDIFWDFVTNPTILSSILQFLSS